MVTLNLRSARVLFPAFIIVLTVAALAFRWNPLDSLTSDEAAKRSALVGAALAPQSDYQRRLLDDEVLSTDEYNEAFALFQGCVREAGARFSPDPPTTNGRGTWMFNVRIDSVSNTDGSTTPNFSAAEDVKACGATYFDAVQERWTAEHLASAEEIEAAKAGIAQCMRGRGIALPEKLAPGWGMAFQGAEVEGVPKDRAAGEAFVACSLDAGAKLGYGPGGAPIP